MTQVYRTLRVAASDKGVLGVVMDAPMNLIGPELVRDPVGLLGALESDQETRVVVLESADPDYFVPHVDLTKVAEYAAEAAKAGGPRPRARAACSTWPGCWDGAGPWRRFSARTTSTPRRPNGTAGSTGPLPDADLDAFVARLDLGDRIGSL